MPGKYRAAQSRLECLEQEQSSRSRALCAKRRTFYYDGVLNLGELNLEAPKLGLCPLCLGLLCRSLCLRIYLQLRLRLWLRLRLRPRLRPRLRLKQRPRRSSLRLACLLPQHVDVWCTNAHPDPRTRVHHRMYGVVVLSV